jgi:hypothetical protein
MHVVNKCVGGCAAGDVDIPPLVVVRLVGHAARRRLCGITAGFFGAVSSHFILTLTLWFRLSQLRWRSLPGDEGINRWFLFAPLRSTLRVPWLSIV